MIVRRVRKLKKLAEIGKRQGISSHPLYGTWYKMVSRCHNPLDSNFNSYGLRGIFVQESWRNSAYDFFRYVEKLKGYHDRERLGLTLDRIDNDSGYVFGNLRWADSMTQSNNQRKRMPYMRRAMSRMLEIDSTLV